MKTNTYMNFAKRFVMMLAVGLMAVNVWGAYSGTFNRINSLSEISSGDSVLVVIQDAKTPANGYAVRNNSTITSSVTINGASITCTQAECVWKVTINNSDYSFQRGTGNSIEYIAHTSSSTLSGKGSSNNNYTWGITALDGYTGYFMVKTSGGRYISVNGTPEFKAYAYEASNQVKFVNQFETDPAVALKQYDGAVSIYKKGAATHTVTINRNNNAYGTVSQASVSNLANNTSISASGNVLTIGTTTVTATPTVQDADYNYAFSSWDGIPAGGKVTGNITVTANFTRTARSYVNYRTKCCTPLDAPTNVAVSVTGTEAATVTWDAVANASGYEYTLDGGENWTATTSPLSLTSSQGLVGATEYSIQVRATGDGTTYCAEGTAADAVAFKTWATVTAASNDALMGTAQVSKDNENWASSVAAADGTKIYLEATASGDSYEWYEWATPASGSISDNEFTGWSGNVTVTANFRTKSLTKLATPEGMASSSITAISAVVSWTAVEHASTYAVTCEKTDDHSTTGIVIGDIDGTSCTITGLTANTGYTWTVKAVGDNSSYKDGDACEGQTFTTDKKKPATVEITTAPSKTTYNSGETFVADGMVVKVTYNNGDIDADYGDYTISPSTVLSPSNTYVTITATMNEVSASVNQAITVNAKLTWKAAGAEDKYTYASGGKVVMPTGADPSAPSCLGDFDTFQGWSASAISVSTDVEPSYVSEETDAAADATFYAVFAKMGDGDEVDAHSTFTVKVASAPGSPYVAEDGATWTYNTSEGLNFEDGNNAGFVKSKSGWIQVALPSSATEAVSFVVTKTGNALSGDAKAELKSGSTDIADITGSALSYNFTASNKELGTYKLANVSSTGKGFWIDQITINYKKVGQVPVEWATTCCTPWEAPAISYSVPSGWKNGDAAVNVSIAEGDTYGSVSYESSNTAVLTVAADGSITAVAPGTATVTATWAGATVESVKYCEASSTSAEITVTGTLTIQFVGGTGTTGSMDNQTVTYNVSEAISANGFSKAGHSFAGWALTDGGEKAYNNQESVAFTANTTLYALWSINKHNVRLTQPTVSEVAAGTLTANGESGLTNVNYGTQVMLVATQNAGYAFENWSVTAGGASLADATALTTTFDMPDADVAITAVYHSYTWDLTSYEVTSEVQLSYTDVQTFDKNGVVIIGNYERSDTKETKQETYEGAWTAKLGDDEIAHGYAFKKADDTKHLTFWIGENKIYDEEVAVTEIVKDHFVDKLWGNDEIIRSGENYDMPILENGAEGGSEATCRDHRFFMGWVLAANEDDPTGDNLVAATGKKSVGDADRTFYAVWAKNVERDLAAGYRQITSAPAGGDSVILAALSGTKYYAIGNSNGSADEIALTNGVVTSPNGFGFKVVSATGGLKFQANSKYMHFNSSSFNVANSDNNGIAALTAVDGAFKVKGTAQSRYLKFTGTAFAVDATESNYTPIYIFKKQAAGKETVKGYYITDCTPRHTISFNVNGGKGSYEDVLKKEGATIDLPVPAEAEYKDWHTYAGWKVGNAGDLLTNTYTVGSTDVTLYAQWNEVSKADVIYKDGETIIETVSGVHQGETYNLKAALTDDDKQFTGWKHGDNLYDAGKAMTMGTPAADSVYVAQWMTIVPTPTTEVITNADLSNGEWVLVTDANQLRTGDVVIIATADNGTVYNKAMGTQGTENYRGNITITKSTDKSKLTPVDGAAKLFLQNGYDEGQFGLYDLNSSENGYLYYSGSGNTLNSKKATIDKSASWSITIEDGIATIKCAGATDDRYIKYNASNPRFSCYGSGQQEVALYKWVKKMTTDMNVSDVTLTDAVIVTDGNTLNIDAASSLDNLIVEAGGEVTLNSTIEKKLTVNNLTIESTSGSSAAGGTSGEVIGTNMTINGDMFLTIQLRSDAMDEDASSQWYCISAPFDVDINNGFYWGNGTQMGHNVDFQIFEWDGDRRATGASGWRRTGGTMKAGIAYFIGFDNERPNQNTIKLKAKTKAITNTTSITLPTHNSTIDDKYSNWNGMGNPNFHHVAFSEDIQAFDYNVQTYNTYETGTYNFVVGTPFFVKDLTSIDIEESNNAQYRAPKRETEERYSYGVRISSEGAQGFDNQMYVRASEDASSEYEIGHDQPTLNGTSSNYGALLWTENYGGKRLAIEEVPLVNGTASYVLTLSAPANGTYSISVAAAQENADLYLTYEGAIIWNLSMGAYTMDLNKGITNGYGLILRAKVPSVVTGVDQIDAKADVQKVIIDEHVYILRGGQMYDLTGKAVK